ncbi:hypothetical protein OXB_0252 [Bacillus sp. OxB-1]|nr:hypothetical protein OXB_0252 [Bacillus sp. OxB-1]
MPKRRFLPFWKTEATRGAGARSLAVNTPDWKVIQMSRFYNFPSKKDPVHICAQIGRVFTFY